MSEIVLGMDVSQTTAAARQFVASLRSMNDVAVELGSSLAVFNAKGEAVRTVLEGVLPTGQKVTQAFKEFDGVMTHLSTTIEGAAGAQRRFADNQLKMAAALERTAAAGRAEAVTRLGIGLGGGLEGASISQLNNVERAIARIRIEIESGRATQQDFAAALATVGSTGTASFNNLTAGAQALAVELRNILKVEQDVAAAATKAAEAQTAALQKQADAAKVAADAQRASRAAVARGALAETALRTTFGLPEGVDAAQVAKFESLITRIKTAVASGSVSISEFNRILQTIRADPTAALGGLGPAAQKVANDIRALTKDVTVVGEEGKRAGEKILISWQGVVRLFESQVIRQAIHAIINEFQQSIKVATEFSIKIGEIQTINQASGISTREFAESVRSLASEFGRKEVDVAEGLYQTFSNQVAKGRDAVQFMSEALRFSQATVSNTADSVNLLSGALKSFGLGVDQTERVAASLFKTIELGRVRASQMANSFGRAGVVARSVGIDIDELNAAIAALTVQGIKFTDAQTFITNLLVKLLEPTKEAKKALQEFGVESGPALIQKLGGFKGFLQFLDTEGDKGAQRIEALTGNMRALRGALGLTGPAFEFFAEALDKIRKAGDEYNNASKIIQETTGERLNKSFIQARVTFEREFGEPFIKTLVSLIETFGGMEKIVTTVGSVIKIAVQGFIAYKIAAIAAATSTLTLSGAFVALATSAKSLSINLQFVRTAALGLGVAFGFPLAIDAVKSLIGEVKNFQAVYEDATVEIQKRDREIAKSNEEARKKIAKQEKETSDILKKEIDDRFRFLIDDSARVVKLSADVRDAQIRYLKEVNEQVKITGQTYESAIRLTIQRMTEAIRRSVDDVRKSQKAVLEGPDRATGKIFDFRIQFANERQQLELIDQRINTLRERGVKLFREGTSQSVEEARKLFDQIEELETRRQTKLAEIQKRRFEATGVGPTITTTDIATGQQRVELVIQTADHEARIKGIVAERIKLEEDFQKKQIAFQEQQTIAREAEKTRLDEIQRLIKRAAEFSILSETGGLRPEFTRGPGGPADIAGIAKRAAADFDKIIEQINVKATDEEKKNFSFFLELQKKKQAIVQEVESVIRTEQAKTAQQDILNKKKAFQEEQKGVEEQRDAARRRIEELRVSLEAQLVAFKSAVEVGRSRSLGIAPLTPFIPGAAEEEVEIERAQKAKEEALRLIREARRAGLELAKEPTREVAEQFEQLISQARAAISEFIRLRTSTLPTEVKLPGEKTELTAAEKLTKFREEAAELTKQFDVIDEGKKKLEEALATIRLLNAQRVPIADQLGLVGDTAQVAGDKMTVSFSNANQVVTDLSSRVNLLYSQLLKLQTAIPKADAIPQAPVPVPQGESWGGLIHYFSGGGFVARGRDRIPAMLAAGEMVMNPEATQRWYPVLSAMNARQPVKYFSQGGPVTNVGDINITVRGGSTSNETLHEVAQGLRRGLRRGTITLGD